jgi:hypothetical protein
VIQLFSKITIAHPPNQTAFISIAAVKPSVRLDPYPPL